MDSDEARARIHLGLGIMAMITCSSLWVRELGARVGKSPRRANLTIDYRSGRNYVRFGMVRNPKNQLAHPNFWVRECYGLW